MTHRSNAKHVCPNAISPIEWGSKNSIESFPESRNLSKCTVSASQSPQNKNGMPSCLKQDMWEGKEKFTEVLRQSIGKYRLETTSRSPEKKLSHLSTNTLNGQRDDACAGANMPLDTLDSIDILLFDCAAQHTDAHPTSKVPQTARPPSDRSQIRSVRTTFTPPAPCDGGLGVKVPRNGTERPSRKHAEKTPDRKNTAASRHHKSVHEYRKAFFNLYRVPEEELEPPKQQCPPSPHTSPPTILLRGEEPLEVREINDRAPPFCRTPPPSVSSYNPVDTRADARMPPPNKKHHPVKAIIGPRQAGKEGARGNLLEGGILEPLPPSSSPSPTQMEGGGSAARESSFQGVGEAINDKSDAFEDCRRMSETLLRPPFAAPAQSRPPKQAPRSVILSVEGPGSGKMDMSKVKIAKIDDAQKGDTWEAQNDTPSQRESPPAETPPRASVPRIQPAHLPSNAKQTEELPGNAEVSKTPTGYNYEKGKYEILMSYWTRETVFHSWMGESLVEIFGSKLLQEVVSQGDAKTNRMKSPTAFAYAPPPAPRETPHSPRSLAIGSANGIDVVESWKSSPTAIIGENLMRFIFEAPLFGTAAAVGVDSCDPAMALRSRLMDIYFNACLESHMEILQHAWFNAAYNQLLALKEIEYLEEHGRFLIENECELVLLGTMHLFENSAPRHRSRGSAMPYLYATHSIQPKPKTITPLQRIAKWFSYQSQKSTPPTPNTQLEPLPSVAAKPLSNIDVILRKRSSLTTSRATHKKYKSILLKNNRKFPEPICNSINEFIRVIPPPISTIVTIQKPSVSVSDIDTYPLNPGLNLGKLCLETGEV